MLIKEVRKTKIKSNKLKLKLYVFRLKKYNYFLKGFVNRIPQNIKGIKTLRCRKKKYLKKKIFISLLRPNLPNVFLIKYIFYFFKLNKILMKVVDSNGTYLIKQTPSSINLFNYFTTSNIFKKKILKLITLDYQIIRIPHNSKISNIELFFNNGIQYAKSNGTYARIIMKNFLLKKVILELPSKERKLFSLFSFASFWINSLKEHSKLIKDDIRYKRFNGKGPIVRGVAKNPVDHPHGGRTKSLKFPRTPWGKPTKLK